MSKRLNNLIKEFQRIKDDENRHLPQGERLKPIATESYINAYREMWDSDEVQP